MHRSVVARFTLGEVGRPSPLDRWRFSPRSKEGVTRNAPCHWSRTMSNLPPTDAPAAGQARRRRPRVFGPLLLVLSASATWWRWHGTPPTEVPPKRPDDPRLTFPTPFLNVRPEVQYVGDAECAKCHSGRTDTYHQHPMGRSMSVGRALRETGHLGEGRHASFAAGGFPYFDP